MRKSKRKEWSSNTTIQNLERDKWGQRFESLQGDVIYKNLDIKYSVKNYKVNILENYNLYPRYYRKKINKLNSSL